MTEKCRKRTATLVLCEEMAFATRWQSLVLQTLHNRKTRTRRERVVLTTKAGDMPLWYGPFCRADISIAPKEAPT